MAYYLIGNTTGAANTPVPGNLLDGYGTDGHVDFNSDSYAAFGEVNWRPIDALTISSGLRYTCEQKTGTYATTVFGGLQTASTALNNAKLSILRPQSYAAAVNQGALTGRFNIAYQVTPGVLGYVSFANGAKSGGINESGLPLDANKNPVLSTAVVKPENNVAYEVGLKTDLFDRRLIFKLDGFYTDVRDFQANVTDTPRHGRPADLSGQCTEGHGQGPRSRRHRPGDAQLPAPRGARLRYRQVRFLS